jgi:hypothetical protein
MAFKRDARNPVSIVEPGNSWILGAKLPSALGTNPHQARVHPLDLVGVKPVHHGPSFDVPARQADPTIAVLPRTFRDARQENDTVVGHCHPRIEHSQD